MGAVLWRTHREWWMTHAIWGQASAGGERETMPPSSGDPVTGTRAPDRAGLGSGSGLFRHLDGDGELDVGVELGRDQVRAERADGLVEVDLAPVELDVRLDLDGVGDVVGRHRPEQAATLASPMADGDGLAHEPGGDLLGRRAVAGVAHGARPAHGL